MDNRWKSVDEFLNVNKQMMELLKKAFGSGDQFRKIDEKYAVISEQTDKNNESWGLLGPIPVARSLSETTTELTTVMIQEEISPLMQPRKEGFPKPRLEFSLFSNSNSEEEVGMFMSSSVEVNVQDDQELNGDELESMELYHHNRQEVVKANGSSSREESDLRRKQIDEFQRESERVAVPESALEIFVRVNGVEPRRSRYLDGFLGEWASEIHENKVNVALSRLGFLNLPSFSGVNPYDWVKICEEFFDINPSSEVCKESLVADLLIGKAKAWYWSWCVGNEEADWDEFVDDLCEHFGNKEQLDNVESSVVKKLSDFEEESQVGSKEKFGLGCEVAGSDIVVLDDKESKVVKNSYGVNCESNKKLGSEITTKSEAVQEVGYKHLCNTVHEESDDSVGNDNKAVIDNTVGNDDLIGIMILVYDRGKLVGRVLMTLLEEWRVSIIKESKSSNKPELILVLVGFYLQDMDLAAYPIDNITLPHSALYGPKGMANTDFVIRELMNRSVPPNKLVLGLPYHGDAWTVVDPDENSVGVPASGPASTMDGSTEHKNAIFFVRSYGYGAAAVYNATYMVNLFSVSSNWINFAYAKERKLLGYNVFQLSNNDNWILSRTAQGQDADHQNKRKLQVLIWVIVSGVLLFLGIGLCYYYQRKGIRLKRIITFTRRRQSALANNDVPNLQAFGFSTIKATTDNFSSRNKLGEGGFGPVYKGKLLNGKEIAVKRLSKTSHQRAEEFSNEITSTATPQHVNLVRVLGFLQLISGKRTNCYYGPHENLNLLEYAYDLRSQGAGPEFVDRSLGDTWSSCKLVTCLKLALLCVQEKPEDRPTMLEVSNMLKIESATAQSPKRPAISISSGHSSTQLKEGLIGVTWDDWGHFSKVQLVKNLHSYRVAKMVFLSWLYKLFDNTQDLDSEKTGWENAIDGPCNLEDKEVLKEGSLSRHLIERMVSKGLDDQSSTSH